MSATFVIFVIAIIVLVFKLSKSNSEANNWQERAKEYRSQYLEKNTESSRLQSKINGMPDWSQMIRPRYANTYYMEYGKPLDDSSDFAIQRYGGALGRDEASDFYHNSDLFAGVYEEGEDFTCETVFDETIGMYVVSAVIRNKWRARGHYCNYTRVFITPNEELAVIAEFVMREEYEDDIFAPPASYSEGGFDLTAIDTIYTMYRKWKKVASQTPLPSTPPESSVFTEQPGSEINLDGLIPQAHQGGRTDYSNAYYSRKHQNGSTL